MEPSRQTDQEMRIARDTITDDEGNEWILLRAAIGLMPSNVPGKKTHINTVHRMLQSGRLQGRVRRQGGRRIWYVRRDEILALSRLEPPEQKPRPVGTRERLRSEAWAERVLERARTRKTS